MHRITQFNIFTLYSLGSILHTLAICKNSHNFYLNNAFSKRFIIFYYKKCKMNISYLLQIAYLQTQGSYNNRSPSGTELMSLQAALTIPGPPAWTPAPTRVWPWKHSHQLAKVPPLIWIQHSAMCSPCRITRSGILFSSHSVYPSGFMCSMFLEEAKQKKTYN